MITLELSNGLPINLPQSWNDVTVATYAKIQGLAGNDLLSALLQVPIEIVNKVHIDDLAFLWEFLDFIRYDLPYEPESVATGLNIGLKSVAQIERAKMYITNYPFWDVCPNVYAVYFTPDNEPFDEVKADQYAINKIDNWPITKVYSQYLYLTEEINKFITRYKHLFEGEPDENELAANIQRFEKYGWLNTLHAKCEGNPVKVEEMKLVPADLFYMFLSIDKDKNDYQKELHKLNSISK